MMMMDYWDTPTQSWADAMSDQENEAWTMDEEGNARAGSKEDEDVCDHLLHYFPVPGEIWVHLRSRCNYLSSLPLLFFVSRGGTDAAPFWLPIVRHVPVKCPSS